MMSTIENMNLTLWIPDDSIAAEITQAALFTVDEGFLGSGAVVPPRRFFCSVEHAGISRDPTGLASTSLPRACSETNVRKGRIDSIRSKKWLPMQNRERT